MGTLFSALDIGRAGLQVAQVQLDITSHNIANVNKEGYSRQRVNLISRQPLIRPFGAIGRGPAVGTIQRLREDFLDTVYRQQAASLGRSEVQGRLFQRLEDIFQEPSEFGFSNRLNVFLDSLQDLANNPETLPVRTAVIAEAESIALAFNQVSQRLRILRNNANEEIRGIVPEINSLGGRIADLNRAIRNAELNERTANDLRDDRDVLLDSLSKLVNIDYREREDGQIDVLIGGASFVNGDRVRQIEAVPDATLDPVRDDLLAVRFAGTGTAVSVTNGELFGALNMRDQELPAVSAEVDALAAALIRSVNQLHAQGRGLTAFTSLQAGNPVAAPNAALNQALLPFPVENGSFDVVVYDAAGNIADTITINLETTGPAALQTDLADIESAIDASPFLSALIDGSGRLNVTAAAGFSFRFAEDSSGALAALGLNGLFTGFNAGNIGVNGQIASNPALLSSGFSLDLSETGDNTAALAMAALRNAAVLGGGTQSLNDFYQSLVVQVGIDARANADSLRVEQAFVADFDRRRQEVSGVSLDEEVTNLLQYQRAFEASTRIITTTDRMLDALFGIVT